MAKTQHLFQLNKERNKPLPPTPLAPLLTKLAKPSAIKKLYFSKRKEKNLFIHWLKKVSFFNPLGAGKKRSAQIKDLQLTINSLTANINYNDIERATLLYSKLNDIRKEIKFSEIYLFDSALDHVCADLQEEIRNTKIFIPVMEGKNLEDLRFESESKKVAQAIKKREPDTKFLGFNNKFIK
ncbi:MAG TPA: hypothetical protein VFP93_01930 [Gammaproteobacteria bacterium]|nr:hypothetical protein [Gammaproteobacteria bacterium]